MIFSILLSWISAHAPEVWSDAQVDKVLTNQCQMCHSRAYVTQQRMTMAQWTATLKKMKSWGAMIDEEPLESLALSLSTRYGAQANIPKFETQDVELFVAPTERAPTPKEVDAGKKLFMTRCLACHGPKAKGLVGVRLSDRQVLQLPQVFEATVKNGRGLMPAQSDLSSKQISSLRAYLRNL